MTVTDTAVTPAARQIHELRNMSAREIAGSIGSGDLSSAEVVEHFIARLHAVNGKLNSVTVDLSGSARKAAADVDRARAARVFRRWPACR